MNNNKIPRNGCSLIKCMDCWMLNSLATPPIKEYCKFLPRNKSAKLKCKDSVIDRNRD